MFRARRAILWLCLLILVLAAVAPAASEHFSLILGTVWLLFVPVLLTTIGRERACAREQIAALQSLVPPRAPPVCLSFS